MSIVREIKKQIDRQTRPSVGAVKVTSESSLYSDENSPTWDIGRTRVI